MEFIYQFEQYVNESNDEWTINYIDLLESYKIRQEFLQE